MRLLERQGFSELDYIASGSSADVYAAIKTTTDRLVAIKVLKPAVADNKSYRMQFLGTTERLNDLCQQSPNNLLVPVVEQGEIGQQPYLVMPFAAGGTLRDRIHATKDASANTRRATATKVVPAIARGLGLMHDGGLIHRDVKPSNIFVFSTGALTTIDATDNGSSEGSGLLAPDEMLQIGDFGLATNYRDQSILGRLPAGTPGYAAPETLAVNPSWSPQADIYSATLCIIETLLGMPPDASWPTQLASRNYDSKLIAELRTGTSDKPAQRHKSMREWGEQLQEALDPPARQPILSANRITASLASVALVALGFFGANRLAADPDSVVELSLTNGTQTETTSETESAAADDTQIEAQTETTLAAGNIVDDDTQTETQTETTSVPAAPATAPSWVGPRSCVVELADLPYSAESIYFTGASEECPELELRHQYDGYQGGDLVPWDQGVAQCWSGPPLVRLWVGFRLPNRSTGWLPLTPNTDESKFAEDMPGPPRLRQQPNVEAQDLPGNFDYDDLAGNAVTIQLDLPETLGPSPTDQGDYHLGGCWQDADRDALSGIHFFLPPGIGTTAAG